MFSYMETIKTLPQLWKELMAANSKLKKVSAKYIRQGISPFETLEYKAAMVAYQKYWSEAQKINQ